MQGVPALAGSPQLARFVAAPISVAWQTANERSRLLYNSRNSSKPDAAVDDNFRADDEARFRREQKSGGPRNFVRLAKSFEQGLRLGCFFKTLHCIVRQIQFANY